MSAHGHTFFSCQLRFDEILKEVNASPDLEASNSDTIPTYITPLPPKLAPTWLGPGAIKVVIT